MVAMVLVLVFVAVSDREKRDSCFVVWFTVVRRVLIIVNLRLAVRATWCRAFVSIYIYIYYALVVVAAGT